MQARARTCRHRPARPGAHTQVGGLTPMMQTGSSIGRPPLRLGSGSTRGRRPSKELASTPSLQQQQQQQQQQGDLADVVGGSGGTAQKKVGCVFVQAHRPGAACRGVCAHGCGRGLVCCRRVSVRSHARSARCRKECQAHQRRGVRCLHAHLCPCMGLHARVSRCGQKNLQWGVLKCPQNLGRV